MSSHLTTTPDVGMSLVEVLALAGTIAVVGTQAMMMSPLLTDVAGALGVSPAAVGGSVAVYGVTTGLASLGLAPWAPPAWAWSTRLSAMPPSPASVWPCCCSRRRSQA